MALLVPPLSDLSKSSGQYMCPNFVHLGVPRHMQRKLHNLDGHSSVRKCLDLHFYFLRSSPVLLLSLPPQHSSGNNSLVFGWSAKSFRLLPGILPWTSWRLTWDKSEIICYTTNTLCIGFMTVQCLYKLEWTQLEKTVVNALRIVHNSG